MMCARAAAAAAAAIVVGVLMQSACRILTAYPSF